MTRRTVSLDPPSTGHPRRVWVTSQTGVPSTILARHLVLFYLDDPPPMSPWSAVHGIEPQPTAQVERSPTSALIPRTPTMDALAATGVTFLRARVAPVCSPGRASLLTAVRPDRHGVGTIIRDDRGSDALAEFADPPYDIYPTVPSLLPPDVRTVMLGKTHLSSAVEELFVHNGQPGIGWDVMQRLGFEEWWTQLRNVGQTPVPDGLGGTASASLGSYRRYYSSRAGNAERTSLFAADGSSYDPYQTNGAIDELIQVFQGNTQERRIFCYVALSACHGPYDPRPDAFGNPQDFPPDADVLTQEYLDLRDSMLAGDDPLTTWPTYMAQAESVDVQIKRFLDSLDPEVRKSTTIVIAADNGIEQSAFPAGNELGKVYPAPWQELFSLQTGGYQRLKSSLYFWGTSMQVLWSGPARFAYDLPTAGSVSYEPMTIEDLAATIIEYFQVPTFPAPGASIDGISHLDHIEQGLPAGRTRVVTQHFYPTGDWTAIVHGVWFGVDGSDPLRPERLEQRLDALVLDGEVEGVAAGWYALMRRWTTEHHFTGGGALVLDGTPHWEYELYRTFGPNGELEGNAHFELEQYESAALQAHLEAILDEELGTELGIGDFMFIDLADGTEAQADLDAEGAATCELADATLVQWDPGAEGILAELADGSEVFFEVGSAEATGDLAVPVDLATGLEGTWVLDASLVGRVDLADGSTAEVDGVDPGGADPVYIPCELADASLVEWDSEAI